MGSSLSGEARPPGLGLCSCLAPAPGESQGPLQPALPLVGRGRGCQAPGWGGAWQLGAPSVPRAHLTGALPTRPPRPGWARDPQTSAGQHRARDSPGSLGEVRAVLPPTQPLSGRPAATRTPALLSPLPSCLCYEASTGRQPWSWTAILCGGRVRLRLRPVASGSCGGTRSSLDLAARPSPMGAPRGRPSGPRAAASCSLLWPCCLGSQEPPRHVPLPDCSPAWTLQQLVPLASLI